MQSDTEVRVNTLYRPSKKKGQLGVTRTITGAYSTPASVQAVIKSMSLPKV